MEFPLAKGTVFLDVLSSGTNELRILLDRNELGTQNLNVPREPSHLKLCKNCMSAFIANRANVAFCSSECKDNYNVRKNRSK